MVIEPQDMESVSPQQKHKENISKSSVIDFIQNMTVGSPIKSKNLERVSYGYTVYNRMIRIIAVLNCLLPLKMMVYSKLLPRDLLCPCLEVSVCAMVPVPIYSSRYM